MPDCTWTRTDNPCPQHGWRCIHKGQRPCARCDIENDGRLPDDSVITGIVAELMNDHAAQARREAFSEMPCACMAPGMECERCYKIRECDERARATEEEDG